MITNAYNERLFSGNWRSKIHLKRFVWLEKQLRQLKLGPLRIIELGCFDARTLRYLPQRPQRYVGFDANWEGGLEQAQTRYANTPGVELFECHNADCVPIPTQPYNVGICLETLEHIKPQLVEAYLSKLSKVVNGYVFFTVPVELGLFFLLKHGLKKLLRMPDYAFAKGEFLYCVLGRLDKVIRDEHKGFDYRSLTKQIASHFDIITVSGVFPGLPIVGLNLTIGIVGKTKSAA